MNLSASVLGVVLVGARMFNNSKLLYVSKSAKIPSGCPSIPGRVHYGSIGSSSKTTVVCRRQTIPVLSMPMGKTWLCARNDSCPSGFGEVFSQNQCGWHLAYFPECCSEAVSGQDMACYLTRD